MSDSTTQRYHQALDHLTRHLDDPDRGDQALARRLDEAHRFLRRQGATQDEADTAIAWVREDLSALGLDLERRGLDLGAWLELDLRLLREALLDTLRAAADPTRLGWQRLALELAAARRDTQPPHVTHPAQARHAVASQRPHNEAHRRLRQPDAND